ncbi:unnamed protein product (macronuclear) [Paramecium tetraurelia]|uniref:2'-phosphotransferase n=1 Tax=Paramecium tetraurelia TaxID=5888 RepID=A0BU35_PARTE|nr:uncharacterized protein GSPATT00032284001 [Paramecium tetraurelia]CAK62052.1 unnamed protein product [Paramecium tetraurelia]|eukprot:XP_001429450.1 hypothetical protein (macronuclear) [Paramecium tetraurelia strain d4-2]
MQQKKKDSPLVQLSKTMSYFLRHGALKEGIPIRQDGFVLVQDLLKQPSIVKLKADLQSIRNVVDNNDKKRFELKEIDGQLYIRCVQGHTIEINEEELLQKIVDPQQFPVIVHGTYFQAWDLIKNTGLNKMARQHIHFAVGLPGDDAVISGMRNTCEVIIEVDMEKAMKAGIQFYVSKNGVVLSSGVDGVIAPQFFKRVTNRKGQDINFQQQQM